MELAMTPMTERQRKYRENYRERVAGWYNGWLHILLIYTIGFTALYVYIANIHDVRWWEYLTIPVVFMFARLLAITSTLVCWASIPVEAMERARMISSPNWAFGQAH